ncbi:MAG: 4-hydroxy-3-methylbut-2-enyl diphosphate reductase [Acidiferrobacteraceae bacterium]|nr:4-hydroxy-3-methylbut-2-enyl diphosphate reductase [Acidiferrobacteraceae bacterium]
MKILLATPRGFCAGVERAIAIVERSLEKYESPIYVRHEVVHNDFVVADLTAKGAIFVDEIAEIPDNVTVIYSAHGVSRSVQNEGAQRDLKIFDATCPLVTKVHTEVRNFREEGCEIVLIGHAGHPEVEGTLGQVDDGVFLVENARDVELLNPRDPMNLAYVTQTTLSIDDTREIVKALRDRFPNIRSPRKDDICYATQNRQDAVKKLASLCDAVFVVGSLTSSNSNRLREIAERSGVGAFLIDSAEEILPSMIEGYDTVGVTAGASAPEVLVEGVVKKLQLLGGTLLSQASEVRETITFSLPNELRTTIESDAE